MAKKVQNLSAAASTKISAQMKLGLLKEAREFQRIAKKIWRADMAKYKPKAYIRTGDAARSIKISSVFKLASGNWAIRVYWDNDLVYHPSILNENGKPEGHAVMLISEGWESKGLMKKFPNAKSGGTGYKLAYYEGNNYIRRVLKEYQKGKPKWLTVNLEWSGKRTR